MNTKNHYIDKYIIRSLSMCNWLCSQGFPILKVADSEKDNRYKVFFFEDSAALHQAMLAYPKKV